MGGAVCVRAERRGEGRKAEEGGGEGGKKKKAPLKAEWKLTPAPKWLRVRPPPPPAAPPPGHVLPSFLKGGLGISVGVVGPAAAPSPRSSATRPPPPRSARRRRWRGCGDISPQRHTRHPALGAGIAPAPQAVHPPHPPLFLSCRRPPPPRGLQPRRSPGRRPPLGPTGCGPDSGAAARNLRPSWARGNNSARPSLPAAALAPFPARQWPRRGARGQPLAPGRGSARGRPAGPGLRSPTGEGRAASEPSGTGNGTGQLPARGDRALSPRPEAGVFRQPRRSHPFPLRLTLILRRGDR